MHYWTHCICPSISIPSCASLFGSPVCSHYRGQDKRQSPRRIFDRKGLEVLGNLCFQHALKSPNLHQHFTDFEAFKARFRRKKQCTFLIKKYFHKIGYLCFEFRSSFRLESKSIYLIRYPKVI